LFDKRLGIAGGPVDKSWLLLRAYTRKTLGKDIAEAVKPNFAAPPLLNELMLQGDLDAALNFWHYAARLQANGMQQLIAVDEILPELGVNDPVPLLGWVFNEEWGNANREAVLGFLQAVRDTQDLMRDSDEVWDGFLRPLTKAENDTTLFALRDSFRQGIPNAFGATEIAAAEQVFGILAELGGEKLIGNSKTLAPGTFWDGASF
jgi:NitT/TauT family transport system substrate-binding protein